jgi:hypothetical protein
MGESCIFILSLLVGDIGKGLGYRWGQCQNVQGNLVQISLACCQIELGPWYPADPGPTGPRFNSGNNSPKKITITPSIPVDSTTYSVSDYEMITLFWNAPLSFLVVGCVWQSCHHLHFEVQMFWGSKSKMKKIKRTRGDALKQHRIQSKFACRPFSYSFLLVVVPISLFISVFKDDLLIISARAGNCQSYHRWQSQPSWKLVSNY